MKAKIFGKGDEHDDEAIKLTKIPPQLPAKMCEKYGLKGVTIMCVTKSGVAFLAGGHMPLKTLASAVKACDEYKKLLTKQMEKMLQE